MSATVLDDSTPLMHETSIVADSITSEKFKPAGGHRACLEQTDTH
jgi:hypothetical protein